MRHVCGEWCDCEPFAMGVSASKPKPDPEHEVPDLHDRLIGHCAEDCRRALEEGRLQVETPTHCVDMSQSSVPYIGAGQDVRSAVHPWGGSDVGEPYFELRFEVDTVDVSFYEELVDHGCLEGPLVLHGDMHLWRMDVPITDVQFTPTMDDGFETSMEVKWYEAEAICFR